MKIDGKQIAADLVEQLKERVEKLKSNKIIPHLYIITFGHDESTQSYLKQKILRAGQVDAKITIKRFGENVSTESVHRLIEKLNKDKKVHGIIVQRPLTKNLDEEHISNLILLEKDVDGFAPHSPFATPVALAVIKLIETTMIHENIHEFLKSKKIAILGKGVTAGGPTIKLFKSLGIKIKVIDSKTKDRRKILKSADIIISAVGKKVLSSDLIKKGVILIGIGMHTVEGKLKGDYDEEDVMKKASFYSPTPGGVGPVNVTMLIKNLIEATEKQVDKKNFLN